VAYFSLIKPCEKRQAINRINKSRHKTADNKKAAWYRRFAVVERYARLAQ
jgi:hypothetical protein